MLSPPPPGLRGLNRDEFRHRARFEDTVLLWSAHGLVPPVNADRAAVGVELEPQAAEPGVNADGVWIGDGGVFHGQIGLAHSVPRFKSVAVVPGQERRVVRGHKRRKAGLIKSLLEAFNFGNQCREHGIGWFFWECWSLEFHGVMQLC